MREPAGEPGRSAAAMPERATAEEQLERVLYILPAGACEGGASLAELAATLGVRQDRVLGDLEEVTSRAYYHPAGGADDLQILIERDRVSVWTAGEFRRPVRLSSEEALALGVGLRVLAAEQNPVRREELLELARRLERQLAACSPQALLPRYAVEEGDAAGEGIGAFLAAAARERRRCRIRYLKPGAAEPAEFGLCPYAILISSGKTYVVGHCEEEGAVRVFRLDRVLEAVPREETFEVPPDFNPAGYISDGGRVYRADREIEAVVRYTPGVARWVVEKGPVERCEDGRVVVRYRVADPRWLVRHVLRYGPEAEVLEPEEIRALVAESAMRLCA